MANCQWLTAIRGENRMSRTIKKHEMFPSQREVQRGNAESILSLEDQREPVILELSHPAKLDGMDVTEITVKCPSVGQILESQGQEERTKDSEIRALVRVTEWPPEALEALHVRDFLRLQALYWAFTV